MLENINLSKKGKNYTVIHLRLLQLCLKRVGREVNLVKSSQTLKTDGMGMGWDGMAWGWDGMGRDGMGRYGMAWHGMGWDGMAWHDMACHGMAWCGNEMAWGWDGMR